VRPGATCDDIEAILEGERPRLVRLCARLAGSAESAEDLAQETLIEAWRHLHKLHEPAGYAAWLSAIARNVCRRWTAARRDENALALVSHDEEAAASIGGEPADPYDFETDLEQGELAELLDRALALLPAGTRAVLIKRYVDASPHAEIAAALGMTEGAVKVKVHRGKLALRRVLTTDLRVDAATFGIVDPDASPVQVTELWCPVCGKHRLEAQFGDEAADLRCPLCCASREVCIYGSLPVNAMRGHTALQAALRQQTQVIAAYFRAAMSGEQQRCTRCGRPLALPVRAMHTGLATYQDVCVFASACVFCESSCSISWRMLAQSRPEVWQFWQRHPRMYTLPPSEIETGGIEAVVTGFRSVNGRAGVDIITARDSLRVLGVHPAPGG
jgi:RNA polymerase sigma-70 factor (ECF subfamily)